MTAPVAFLFLGEMLLLPHLWPIVEALSRLEPDLAVDLWVSTSEHEERIAGWRDAAALDPARVRLRRAPGFRALGGRGTDHPALPAKLPMLLRLWPRLLRTRVAVCAEQTSLWIPALLPTRTRFLKTSHGVGSMSARDDRRRRAAFRLLVPSEREKATYTSRGFGDERVQVTGYVKASFARRAAQRRPLFAEARPVVVYAPHWQRFRSSWWAWGREIVNMLARQDRFNVIIAPHQRLAERDPMIRDVLGAVARLPHVHVDLDSFAMVDGSYMAAADIYLGDTSSQVVEFLADARPCVFLNAQRLDWQATGDHDFWRCGDVVDDPAGVFDALLVARDRHQLYRAEQVAFAAASLGDTSDEAPVRAARAVLAAMG